MIQRLSILLVSLLLVALIPGTGFADSWLGGRVTDAETGDALPFATVQLAGEGVATGTASSESGRFRFDGLESGTYSVTVFFIGYATRTDTFLVAPDDSVVVTLALVPEAFEVQTVEVTASRIEEETPQIGQISLGSDELAELPGVIEKDPIRTIQLLPGVQAASDFSSGLYVRGGGPDQTLILLDKVTLYNPSHFFGIFSTFNPDAVSNVDLYKGAYPAEYTGRLGAVLDVTSSSGSRDGFEGFVGLSTIAGRLKLEGPVGNGSWLLAGRRTYLDPILNALRKNDAQIPYYYFYDLNGRLDLTLGDRDLLDVFAYWGRDDLRFELTPTDYIGVDWGNRTLGANWRHIFSDDVLATVVGYGSEYTSFTNVFIFGTPIRIDNELREGSLRGDLAVRTGERNQVTLGAQGSVYDFGYTQEFNLEPGVDYGSTPFDVSVFAEDEWSSTTGHTRLRGGLRLRFFSDGDRLLWEPRFLGSRDLSDRLTFNFGAGVYHQYLQLVSTEAFSAGDFYFPVDETTQPGRSLQLSAGLSWLPQPEYRLAAELYYTRLDNLLVFDNNIPNEIDPITTDAIFDTGGTGYATGLELFLERRIGPMRGWVGYTLGWTRRNFEGVNQGDTYAPKYDRRHDASVVGSYTWGKSTLSLGLVYGTGQAFTPASARYGIRNPAIGNTEEGGFVLPSSKNSARLLPYHRMDVSFTRDFGLFGLEAEWFVQVFNLYSRRNEWFVQYDSSDPENAPEVVNQLPVIPSLGVNVAF